MLVGEELMAPYLAPLNKGKVCIHLKKNPEVEFIIQIISKFDFCRNFSEDMKMISKFEKAVSKFRCSQ